MIASIGPGPEAHSTSRARRSWCASGPQQPRRWAPFDFSGALGPESDSESTRSLTRSARGAVYRGGQRGGLSLTAWSQPSRTLRVTVELETNL